MKRAHSATVPRAGHPPLLCPACVRPLRLQTTAGIAGLVRWFAWFFSLTPLVVVWLSPVNSSLNEPHK